MVDIYNPRKLGDWDRKIIQAKEFEASLGKKERVSFIF